MARHVLWEKCILHWNPTSTQVQFGNPGQPSIHKKTLQELRMLSRSFPLLQYKWYGGGADVILQGKRSLQTACRGGGTVGGGGPLWVVREWCWLEDLSTVLCTMSNQVKQINFDGRPHLQYLKGRPPVNFKSNLLTHTHTHHLIAGNPHPHPHTIVFHFLGLSRNFVFFLSPAPGYLNQPSS